MESISLQPIGQVDSVYRNPDTVPLWGNEITVIQVFPEFSRALLRIEEHSHYWILSWFDKALRNVLSTRPERIDPNLPEYGVFGLRAPVRPNPIGLSLVKLEKVEGNMLYVSGFDAISGTPVLDIKPYYEQDIIFSPVAPYLPPKVQKIREQSMLKEAINHHQEVCPDLRLALRMGLIAERNFGKLNSADLLLAVTGSPCLGDVLQGITKARLANPPRFSFANSGTVTKSTWQKGNTVLNIELIKPIDNVDLLDNTTDEGIFSIKLSHIL